MSHDTIVHRIVRPAMRLLAHTPVTPDHLTALRFVTGVAAAGAFALGAREWINIGAAVFLFSALLDRADGELARQTGQFSRHGHRYDLWADWIAGALAFIGLGVGARGGPLGLAAPVLGLLGAAGTTVLFWAMNIRDRHARPQGSVGSKRVLVDPDDAMFGVPLLLWSFGAAGVLLPAGTLAPLVALWTVQRQWPRRQMPQIGRRRAGLSKS